DVGAKHYSPRSEAEWDYSALPLQMTYAELNDQADLLARHLQTLGVGPEVRVGVCLERSLQTVVALLAILKAGGVYVPLDPSYPAAHLDFILRDTQLSILITNSDVAGGKWQVASD